MSTGIQHHLEEIRDIAEKSFGTKRSHIWKEPGNKYEHGIRTAKLLFHLRDAMGESLGELPADEVLTVAAWFHDICNGQEHHEEAGEQLLPSLIGHLCTEEELAAVCDLVRVHDSRCSSPKKELSDGVLLLQDADLLDHLGTYSIWITFCEFCHLHKTPMDYAVQFENGVFDRFVNRHRTLVNFPVSLTVFDEKIQYEKDFASRMMRELRGELK